MEVTKTGRYICKYLDYGASPLSLLGETEEEAYKKLILHLESKRAPMDDPEPPAAA